MRALFGGQLSIWVVLLFPTLVLSGLLMSYIVGKARKDLEMAKYEVERGPVEEMPKMPNEKDLIPGYQILTYDDYNEVLEKIKKEKN